MISFKIFVFVKCRVTDYQKRTDYNIIYTIKIYDLQKILCSPTRTLFLSCTHYILVLYSPNCYMLILIFNSNNTK